MVTRQQVDDSLSPGEVDGDAGDEPTRPGPVCPRCLMPGMVFQGRFSARQTSILLRELRFFWRQVVTMITILPFAAPGPRRARQPLIESTACLAWTITTLDIDVVDGLCNPPLPDT